MKGIFAATAFPTPVAAAALAWLAAAPAAFADDDAVVAAAASAATDFSKGGFAKESYYVTLGLFLLSLPGQLVLGIGRGTRAGGKKGEAFGGISISASFFYFFVSTSPRLAHLKPRPPPHHPLPPTRHQNKRAGLWSQIKRAPKAKRVRRVYEVPGPASPEAMPLDERARQIFRYFKQYNYSVAKPGEGSSAPVAAAAAAAGGGDGPSTSSSSSAEAADVIRFVGRYAASRGQAAALVFYVFCGLASTALVLSIAAPVAGHGEWWYALTALSPLAGLYYWQRGDRDEEFLVKMTTADDDSVTDISVEGDAEEADRMAKTLSLAEKGKVYVKGILG